MPVTVAVIALEDKYDNYFFEAPIAKRQPFQVIFEVLLL